ncbi:hypothetical protein ARZXY2_4328 (plasmid) [Arthrobacter sp. ZXY-2]|nr:hypothetical protein ARZXY2_4328 [Arthrobacter sp. ZXY-2]
MSHQGAKVHPGSGQYVLRSPWARGGLAGLPHRYRGRASLVPRTFDVKPVAGDLGHQQDVEQH